MRLSDAAIRARLDEGSLVIDPAPRDRAIQPASIDFHLSPYLCWYAAGSEPVVPHSHCTTWSSCISDEMVLEPGDFILGSTLERLELPSDLVATVEGKSSLGRIGLAVHITAGFIDPGFRGHITLELKNMNRVPVKLVPRMPICQIGFEPLVGKVERPYGSVGLGSRYQDSQGTVPPREPSGGSKI